MLYRVGEMKNFMQRLRAATLSRPRLAGGIKGREQPSAWRFKARPYGTEPLTTPTSGINAREPLLFTPGPLTTSPAVKQAMLVDIGSRDPHFVAKIQNVRENILAAGGVSSDDGFECVIVQGSGTFGVESTLTSAVPLQGSKILVVANGAYGYRMAEICRIHGIDFSVLAFAENEVPTAQAVKVALENDVSLTHVAVVHHETTTGSLSPIDDIARAVKSVRGDDVTLVVDSMSGFGALPIDLTAGNIDYLVSSANKCLESVPGFSFVIAKRNKLEATKYNTRTLALDLFSQWRGLESNGQFRFTPPTHAILAMDQALREFEEEGGAVGRLARYRHNHSILIMRMTKLGYELYIDEEIQGPIISTFLTPSDKEFDFEMLYDKMASRGISIYPGKLTEVDSFRIGTIGRLFEGDIHFLASTLEDCMRELGIPVPVNY